MSRLRFNGDEKVADSSHFPIFCSPQPQRLSSTKCHERQPSHSFVLNTNKESRSTRILGGSFLRRIRSWCIEL